MLDVLGAHQAVNARPADQAQDDHHSPDATAQGACQWPRLQHRRQCKHEEDVRNRREDVVNPLQEVTHRAAKVAADSPQNRTNQRRKQGGSQADGDRHLRAFDHFGEHVTPQLVAAEGQGVRFDGGDGFDLRGALGPLFVAWCQRVYIADVHRSAGNSVDDGGLRAIHNLADEMRRRKWRAHLFLPVFADQAQLRHQHDADEKQRDIK